jgi:hypothetical protein
MFRIQVEYPACHWMEHLLYVCTVTFMYNYFKNLFYYNWEGTIFRGNGTVPLLFRCSTVLFLLKLSGKKEYDK